MFGQGGGGNLSSRLVMANNGIGGGAGGTSPFLLRCLQTERKCRIGCQALMVRKCVRLASEGCMGVVEEGFLNDFSAGVGVCGGVVNGA